MTLADLKSDTIRNYRERVRQCEKLEEYALAVLIREILVQEQVQIIDLATALGIEVPNIDCETGRAIGVGGELLESGGHRGLV
jgi:bacterioferritin